MIRRPLLIHRHSRPRRNRRPHLRRRFAHRRMRGPVPAPCRPPSQFPPRHHRSSSLRARTPSPSFQSARLRAQLTPQSAGSRSRSPRRRLPRKGDCENFMHRWRRCGAGLLPSQWTERRFLALPRCTFGSRQRSPGHPGPWPGLAVSTVGQHERRRSSRSSFQASFSAWSSHWPIRQRSPS